MEVDYGCFATARSETRTGADYYVAPSEGLSDLDAAYRLEVSGTDRGNETTIRSRLKEKILQAQRGASNLPAVACVVGFRAARVAFQRTGGAD